MDRNLKISFLQIWGIILVVFGHSGYHVESSILGDIGRWIYHFDMPLFMFISGFLFRYTNKIKNIEIHNIRLLGWNGFVWKKIKRLLIPGLLLSTFAYFPKYLLNEFAKFPVEMSWSGYIHMYLYPYENAITFFWFLPTLFIIFIIYILIVKVFKKENDFCFLFLLLCISLLLHLFNPLADVSIFNLRGVVFYLFFFVLGDIGCKYNIHELQFRHLYLYCFLSFVLSVVFVFVPAFFAKDVFTSINGIFLSLLLANIYEKKNFKFFNYMFGASSAIYMYSWFAQAFCQQILIGAFDVLPWVGSLLAFVTGVYFPVILYKYVNAHKNIKIVKIIAPYVGL